MGRASLSFDDMTDMATKTKRPSKPAVAKKVSYPLSMLPDERRAAGKRLRRSVPLESHTGWRAPAGRTDPLSILRTSDANRQPDLVPLRYGRMLQTADQPVVDEDRP
jgi:hypothetical protein